VPKQSKESSMKLFWIRASVTVLAAAGPASGAALGQSPGVPADRSVGVVPLASFAGLSPPQIWRRIDELEFWAIPRDPPAGFYATIDASSPAALRSRLHALIKDHCVFPYGQGRRAGDLDWQAPRPPSRGQVNADQHFPGLG
jgi:hypothetical protein